MTSAPRYYDVVIVGGGVIGLSIARALHQRGVRKLAIVERGRCGQEASWAAAGMLGPQAETTVADGFFNLCAASRDQYPGLAAALRNETGADIELDRTGTLYLAFSEEDARALESRYEWQRAAGLPVERLAAAEARRLEPFASPDVHGALLFPNDWQVDNRKLIDALRCYCEINAIEMLEGIEVDSVEVSNGRATGVRSGDRTIAAGHTVLAAGSWSSAIKVDEARLKVRVEPIRGQIIAYRTAKPLFGHVIYSHRGYIVPRSDGRVLVGSTTENVGFDKATTESAADVLAAVAAEISPSLGTLEIIDHWSGLRPYASDGLPILGDINGLQDMTIATAHYRNGILLAPLTAELVAERIVSGIEDPAFTIFGADRLRFAAAGAE